MIKASKHTLPLLFILFLALLSCKDQTKNYEQHDQVYKNIDSTVSPGANFFKYANGTWIKNNPIPAAYSSWGIGNQIVEEIRDKLKKISTDAMNAQAAVGSDQQKIGDFYFSGMDTLNIEKQGLEPLKQQLARIDQIKSINDVISTSAYFNKIGASSLFGMYVAQDDKNSEKMVLQFYQTGLGLPERDYYFKTDKRTTTIRKDYQGKHLPAMLRHSGLNIQQAGIAAKKVFAIEAYLAANSRKLEALRDPYKNYNKIATVNLNKLTPGLDWALVLKNLEIKNADSVIIGQPEYYKAVNTALKKFPLEDWKAYLHWHLISSFAPYLNKSAEKEDFRFYQTVLRGVPEQLPRWKSVLTTENDLLDELLGQLFVKDYFPEKTRKRYEDLVEAIRDTYKEHIEKLDWMSPETKKKALAKLSSMRSKVGYPEKWKDYSKLTIDRKSYAGNVMRANIWAYAHQIKKIGKPVDHTEWNMAPQTYNANYSPSNNEITLPAAIFLIPTVKDENVDDAVIYGYAAASTIGHEITHGFDDQGRQYDDKGNLKSWWTAQDSVKFTKKAKMLSQQFSSYKVLDSLHVNGEATLGENIADLGGIVLGLDAFKKTDQYKENKKINGLSPTQRFFLGYSLGWLYHTRDENLANQIMTDVHSPAFLRVNGPFSDVPEFYEAFHIKKGDSLWLAPNKRVKIW
ncbi:Metallopeptidase [Arcticibacter svalbardensis MN12-7]|uniref:Metallopeptidase n=1 Tax=Arcticibacter svalbardensis MN12-7 TaxID=1150600 RepID=R9GXF1_9SPHI|nr:M13 family metallopeptidase [Arcticibacter svalbardensis]EOR96348.1 Metallopeptidase [Arcticibacter svalbardensis MN12-7]